MKKKDVFAVFTECSEAIDAKYIVNGSPSRKPATTDANGDGMVREAAPEVQDYPFICGFSLWNAEK